MLAPFAPFFFLPSLSNPLYLASCSENKVVIPKKEIYRLLLGKTALLKLIHLFSSDARSPLWSFPAVCR